MLFGADCEGVVEEAVLLGAPVTSCADDWSRLSRVVSGRIVNGYCAYVSRILRVCVSYTARMCLA